MEDEIIQEEEVAETPAAEGTDEMKASIMTAVETALEGDYATTDEMVDAAIESLTALKSEPEMGGLGEEADAGMRMPGESEE